MVAIAETGMLKRRVQAFANPEDCAHHGKGENAKKYLRTDDRVEFIFSHRAHLNDLENIVSFVGIGLLYSLSGPDLSTALLHFRLFVGARIYHTIAYLIPLPQPNRAFAFFVGYGVTFSMAYSLLRNRLLKSALYAMDLDFRKALWYPKKKIHKNQNISETIVKTRMAGNSEKQTCSCAMARWSGFHGSIHSTLEAKLLWKLKCNQRASADFL
ncbi:LOW QUALITY PROTEIN: microsomal glutathione S-transferase 1 [Dugong dugon]